MNRAWVIMGLGAAVTVGLFLGAANLYFGELNQDEGWYLYAGRMVADGHMPYRDFAFTQGPLFPLVYSWISPAVESGGLAAGRITTALFGLFAVLLSGWLAFRLVGGGIWAKAALVIAVSLLLANVYHSYYSMVVKTYSLCALFLTAGAVAMTFHSGRYRWVGPACAGLFFAFAAGVRLSAGIWLPVVGLYYLWRHREYGWAWAVFGISGAIGLALVFGSSFVRAPEAAWFWLVHYHAARDGGGGMGSLILKGGFISRWVQAYFVIAALSMVLLLGRILGGSLKTVAQGVTGILWIGVMALSLVHVFAPFPYEDYQVPLMPILAAALAASLMASLRSLIGETSQAERVIKGVTLAILFSSVLAAFSSPLNQAWMVRERDRIWWRLKDRPDLVVLQEAANWLQAEMGESDRVLLTQDTYLAIETGSRVPRGLEMGPFSYYPEWTTEEAQRRNVLNRELLLELLETHPAEWAAISGYGLSIRSPDVTELSAEEQAELRDVLERRYELVRVIPHFGQAQTPLELWRLKERGRVAP